VAKVRRSMLGVICLFMPSIYPRGPLQINYNEFRWKQSKVDFLFLPTAVQISIAQGRFHRIPTTAFRNSDNLIL